MAQKYGIGIGDTVSNKVSWTVSNKENESIRVFPFKVTTETVAASRLHFFFHTMQTSLKVSLFCEAVIGHSDRVTFF